MEQVSGLAPILNMLGIEIDAEKIGNLLERLVAQLEKRDELAEAIALLTKRIDILIDVTIALGKGKEEIGEKEEGQEKKESEKGGAPA